MDQNIYWINIYGTGFRGLAHSSREAAAYAGRHRITKRTPPAYRVAYRVKVTLKEGNHERPRSFDLPTQTDRYTYADHQAEKRRWVEQWEQSKRLENTPCQGLG